MKEHYRPLVSIIIPTYNRGHLIGETLASILAQTYENWECIIVDDGSEDNTKDIIKSYNDRRIKYFLKDHEERSAARNFGIEKASGEYLQFVDSDDILIPEKLEKSVTEIKTKNIIGKAVVLSNFRIIRQNNYYTLDPYCDIKQELLNFRDILYNWDVLFTIPIHCGFFDIKIFKKFKFPSYINYKEDWLMWLSIFQQDISVYFIDEPLALYRIPESIPEKEKRRNIKKELKVLKYLGEFIPKHECTNFYFSVIEKKYTQVSQLQNSLDNYRKTRSYRSSRAIGSFFNWFRRKYNLWRKY